MARDISTLWTRCEIADRILQGENLVIYRGQLLRIPQSWLQAHPGGGLAILHFVGRDATDEIDAFHAEATLEKRVKNYIVGRAELSKSGIWEPMTPPVASGWTRRGKPGEHGQGGWVREAEVRTKLHDDSLLSSEILLVSPGEVAKPSKEVAPTAETLKPPPATLSLEEQMEHSRAFWELHKRIIDAGLYETPYLTGYGPEVARYFTGAIASAVAFSYGWYLTSAFFLGLVWHQLTFTAHDLGHMGVTHNWAMDRVIGTFVADLCGGLSIGWWVDNHNIHHRE
jgi:delta8-fatty-acid desaturase